MADFALATDRLILRGWRDEDHGALDFDHPAVPADSPLRRHITYSIGRQP